MDSEYLANLHFIALMPSSCQNAAEAIMECLLYNPVVLHKNPLYTNIAINCDGDFANFRSNNTQQFYECYDHLLVCDAGLYVSGSHPFPLHSSGLRYTYLMEEGPSA